MWTILGLLGIAWFINNIITVITDERARLRRVDHYWPKDRS